MSESADPANAEPELAPLSWRGESISSIVLGTVQLGMDYGVANRQGQPSTRTVAVIVETAWNHGIRVFDTAQGYGDSESVLGRALRDLGVIAEARVASKLSPPLNPLDLVAIETAIERTFDRLGTNRLWCMMLHVAAWLDHWDAGLGGLLRRYRDAGRIEHLGVSLNSPDEAPRCLSHPDIEILQVACNAWDRRMLRRGVLQTATHNGQLCCVRSIYLKGLLTLPPSEVAQRIPIATEASRRWHEVCRGSHMSPMELAVRYAMTLQAPLVIGAETPQQIADTVHWAKQGPLPAETIDRLAQTIDPVVDDTILTPSRWEKLDGVVLTPHR